jgi:APA family basic amino acid/polyamine antiporter
VQSGLMLLKIGAIAALVIIGFTVGGHAPEHSAPLLEKPFSFDVLKSIGAAMVPIAFAYGGWQTATFVAAEIRDPRRDLSRGLLLGVSSVVVLYLAVNLACLRVLGPAGLDATTTPASDLMRIALGETGARWIALAVTISALGFLSQSMLTAPRVYYAMALSFQATPVSARKYEAKITVTAATPPVCVTRSNPHPYTNATAG